jgi:SAM-dependent methyltransferase
MSNIQRRKQVDKNRKGKGHPIMFGMPEAEMYDDFPEGGGYPKRFLSKAYEIMGVTDPDQVLHVCSGSVKTGVRVDIRAEKNPTIVTDACSLPFPDDSFQWILADPPYTADHAENLYGTGSVYPSPHVLTQECLRVLKPGGFFGIMHHMVPKFKKPGKLVKVYAITQGPGYNIRAWTLFTKME